ncbi:hypothetical protein BX604_6532 [Burkholderia sp. JKS000303]|nr:hypothetical protein BX604_6532 [Burkholderia sp. JKS000303]
MNTPLRGSLVFDSPAHQCSPATRRESSARRLQVTCMASREDAIGRRKPPHERCEQRVRARGDTHRIAVVQIWPPCRERALQMRNVSHAPGQTTPSMQRIGEILHVRSEPEHRQRFAYCTDKIRISKRLKTRETRRGLRSPIDMHRNLRFFGRRSPIDGANDQTYLRVATPRRHVRRSNCETFRCDPRVRCEPGPVTGPLV